MQSSSKYEMQIKGQVQKELFSPSTVKAATINK